MIPPLQLIILIHCFGQPGARKKSAEENVRGHWQESAHGLEGAIGRENLWCSKSGLRGRVEIGFKGCYDVWSVTDVSVHDEIVFCLPFGCVQRDVMCASVAEIALGKMVGNPLIRQQRVGQWMRGIVDDVKVKLEMVRVGDREELTNGVLDLVRRSVVENDGSDDVVVAFR